MLRKNILLLLKLACKIYVTEIEIDDGEILGVVDIANYKTILVQRVLSVQVEHAEELQCRNLFQSFFVINDWWVRGN